MKHVKLFEGFQLVNLSNSNWYGSIPEEAYIESVMDHCMLIAREDAKALEKSFELSERLKNICDKTISERSQEFNAIVHNSRQRNMRPQFAAESVYHTILQGRINSLSDRPFESGGLKIETT